MKRNNRRARKSRLFTVCWSSSLAHNIVTERVWLHFSFSSMAFLFISMTFLPDNLCMMLALGRQRKQRTHVNRKRRMFCINLCASDVPASSNRGSFVSIHHSPYIYLCIARRYKSQRAPKPIMCLLDSVFCVDSGHWHARRLQKASVATYAHPCRRYAPAGMQAWNSM